MCRSIKKLRQPETSASEEEIYAAATQFVRKIWWSGYRSPSRANREAFDAAIGKIAAVSEELLASLQTRPA